MTPILTLQTSQHSPHSDLWLAVSDPAFELWVAPTERYDEALKLHPTAFVELSGWGRDVLPPVGVSVEFAQDFGTLASPAPERLVVHWPSSEAFPRVPAGWMTRFLNLVLDTPHHTLVLVDEWNNAGHIAWFVKRLRELLEDRQAGVPAGASADEFGDAFPAPAH
jgi:hypothetical protein